MNWVEIWSLAKKSCAPFDVAISHRPLAQDLADVPLVGDKSSVSLGRN
jgi:hypothetical protein